jgi:hypothetical protein
LHEGEGGCAPAKGTGKSGKKCFAFRKGKCERGDGCPFIHAQAKPQTCVKVAACKGVCDFFTKRKRCKRFEKGNCKYLHPGSTLKNIVVDHAETDSTGAKRLLAVEQYTAAGEVGQVAKKDKKEPENADTASTGAKRTRAVEENAATVGNVEQGRKKKRQKKKC